MFAKLSDAFEDVDDIEALWKSLSKLQQLLLPMLQGPPDPPISVAVPETVTVPATTTGTPAPTTTTNHTTILQQ